MTGPLVLVGGGHAHLLVLESLTRSPISGVETVLVVDDSQVVYSGMVPGLVAGRYAPEDLTVDLRPLAAAAGVRLVEEAARQIEVDAHRIELADGSRLPYRAASINIGSTVPGLDLPGVREHALPTRPIGELVHRLKTPVPDQRRIVVVGGGAGGVEIAFCLQARHRGEGRDVDITLVTDSAEVLEPGSRALAHRVRRVAARRGLAVRTGTRITAVEPEVVRTADGEEIPCDLLVWSTGAVGHPLFTDSGIASDDRGFAWTRDTLQLVDTPDVFAVGDCATPIHHPGIPKAGVYAVRQGPVLAHNLRAYLRGAGLRHYEPQTDFLALLNLGDGQALGARNGLVFQGRWVMAWKDWLDRRFVRRFQLAPDREATTAS